MYNTPFQLDNNNRLCIVGQGDPTLSISDLDSLGKVLAGKGISKVTEVILDTISFSQNSYPMTWFLEDYSSNYGALPDPFVIEENYINLRISPNNVGELASVGYEFEFDKTLLPFNNSIVTTNEETNINTFFYLGDSSVYLEGTININSSEYIQVPSTNPPRRFFEILKHVLNNNSISVHPEPVISRGGCRDFVPSYVIAIQSPPLSELMNHTLQYSDNTYAELFLRSLGTGVNPCDVSTVDCGIQRVQDILTPLGVDPTGFKQRDGSGLSRLNLVSPTAEVQTLRAMLPHSEWRHFLPLAGETGTLANQFIGTPAQGIVYAKTGTMTGVKALSGLETGNVLFDN
jgi:D-alanyl-D-alanine carboxypeptidase/D-alanyl-D-alanine-endopeptidase (penicillin-binding protein 4)